MKGVYFKEPNCSACPGYDNGDASHCRDCLERCHIEVDILQVGVGWRNTKAVILTPEGRLETVDQSSITVIK